MKPKLNINPKVVNLAEIARQIGYSSTYVYYLLKGQRTNPEALAKVNKAIKNQFKAA